MAVKFSLQLKNLFQPSQKEFKTPDNGYYLPGTTNRAVILIHGLTGTPHEMRFIANYLNRQGYSVSCPRLAKHGTPINVLKRSKWQEFYKTVRENYLEANSRRGLGFLDTGSLVQKLFALQRRFFQGRQNQEYDTDRRKDPDARFFHSGLPCCFL